MSRHNTPSVFDELTEIMEQNPNLVFNNNGYENISSDIIEANKKAIKQIETILKNKIKGFVRFQNFKPKRDGSMSLRYQMHYDDEGSFTGVAYTPLNDFK